MTKQEQRECRFAACYESALVLAKNRIINDSQGSVLSHAQKTWEEQERKRDARSSLRRKRERKR